MVDPLTATFEEIVEAYPNLGHQGLAQRCLAELSTLPGTLLERLDHSVAGRSKAFERARSLWAKNNQEMALLEADLRAGDTDAARQRAIKRRVAGMDKDPFLATMPPDQKEATATHKVAAFELALRDLVSGFVPLSGLEIPTIFRGGAMAQDGFEQKFDEGKEVVWTRMMACTVAPAFVPLHFAWKQHQVLSASSITDPVSYLLEVELDRKVSPKLIWTGDIQGSCAANTYRWQAEVITPPGFTFRVEKLERLSVAGNVPLFGIRARQISSSADQAAA